MAQFSSDSIGGMGGLGLGGNNEGGLLMGLLFGSILGNRNGGGLFGGNNNGGSGDLDAAGIAAKVVELQNSSNLREQVAGLGTEISNSFNLQNLGIQAQFNQVDQAIAASTLANALAAKEAEINALKTANVLQTNIESLSTKSDAQFSATLQAIANDGAATRALINANEMANLRDQLDSERRSRVARETEISITNNNINTNAQFQAQAQIQTQRDFDNTRRFDFLFNQIQTAVATNSNINIGNAGATTNGVQNANPVNLKA